MANKLTTPTGPLGLPSHALRATQANIKAKQAKQVKGRLSINFKSASQHQASPAPYTPRAASARVVTSHNPSPKPYTGQELKPYQGRPGSLDFLALPSLIGSTRIYRKDAKKAKGVDL